MNKAEFKERLNSRPADKIYLSPTQAQTKRAVMEAIERKKERELLERQIGDDYSD